MQTLARLALIEGAPIRLAGEAWYCLSRNVMPSGSVDCVRMRVQRFTQDEAGISLYIALVCHTLADVSHTRRLLNKECIKESSGFTEVS